MGTLRGHKYNGAIDRVNVQQGKTYKVDDCGILKVHNLFDEIPDFYYNADYVVVDPPWNISNLKSFYTKAEKTLDKDFESFLNRIFEILSTLKVNSCYMEFGYQFADEIKSRMEKVFDNVRVIESCYYNTKPCVFIVGENDGHVLDFDTTYRDELKVIEDIIARKEGTVLDFCLGRGAVSRSAYKHGKKFIGTELNINRMAVSIEDLIKKGANVREL